ncbi:MAG: hypothetical protein K0R40_3892 [Burkholderiales bacterium]|nr:hypothetical protein [Burkholderiales bacterium]
MAKKKTTDAASPTPRRRAARPAPAVPPPVDGMTVPQQQELTADDIAREAYQRYLKRGGGHGRDFDDWLEAERELRSRR